MRENKRFIHGHNPSWSKGLTKETNLSIAVQAAKMTGRTKDNHSGVAITAEKLKGRTKETHSGVAEGARKRRGKNKYNDPGRAIAAAKMTGVNNPMYGRMGINNPRYGMKHTDEAKRKISEAGKGVSINVGVDNPMHKRGHTEETKRKMSEARKGSGNLQWKGGINRLPYAFEFDEELKEKIKQRDGYQCQNPYCWGKDQVLCIHHINYGKKNCDENNLITLCNSCNARANVNRDYWEDLYGEIIFRKCEEIAEVKICNG